MMTREKSKDKGRSLDLDVDAVEGSTAIFPTMKERILILSDHEDQMSFDNSSVSRENFRERNLSENHESTVSEFIF